MTSVTSLLPIVNSKQQLVAIIPSFQNLSGADVLELLQFLKAQEFFDKLSSVSLFLPIADPVTLPSDLDARVPVSKVVFCVQESHCADVETQGRLKYLTSRGCRFLVDDFASTGALVWVETKSISVDMQGGLPYFVKPRLSSLKSDLHLAKNIGTPAHLHDALEAGFKLFCGEYAFFPPVNNKSNDGTARTRLLKLLGLVSRDAESRELEELFKQDATLSFMLFKLVSSAAFAQTVRVSSFGQAINLLGRRQLQRWLQLLLYARQQESGGVLNPLMLRAAFRASLMEAICQHQGGDRDQQDCAFMVGMFSLLDKLFGNPLEEILRPLNLIEEVLGALIEKNGSLGAHLQVVELADRQNTGLLEEKLSSLGIDVATYYECLIRAYAWVNQVCQDM